MREYTPVSSAEEWERGELSLLVKTYGDILVRSGEWDRVAPN